MTSQNFQRSYYDAQILNTYEGIVASLGKIMPSFYDGIDFKGFCQNCNFLAKLPGISEGV